MGFTATWHCGVVNGFEGVIGGGLMEWCLLKVAEQEEDGPATTADDMFATAKF